MVEEGTSGLDLGLHRGMETILMKVGQEPRDTPPDLLAPELSSTIKGSKR